VLSLLNNLACCLLTNCQAVLHTDINPFWTDRTRSFRKKTGLLLYVVLCSACCNVHIAELSSFLSLFPCGCSFDCLARFLGQISRSAFLHAGKGIASRDLSPPIYFGLIMQHQTVKIWRCKVVKQCAIIFPCILERWCNLLAEFLVFGARKRRNSSHMTLDQRPRIYSHLERILMMVSFLIG
jgi:hypothetical protein